MFPMDKNKNIPNDINNTEENEQISGQTDENSDDSANPQMDSVDAQKANRKKSLLKNVPPLVRDQF